ncbi:hypothetical protein [Hyphomonas sp.]|uniref:hypothetical protein n=1 Tax=Hyphomonas sp. TaxID=87 RepID=UPI0025C28F0C|nr:hypothetical protein [Hyphomonas sp.]
MKLNLIAFPLLLLPVLLYAGLATFAGSPDVGQAAPIIRTLTQAWFELKMVSGDVWVFDLGDAILLFGFVMLFLELTKSTVTQTGSLINHGLSLAVFVVSLIAFLLLRNYGTSEFFLLLLMLLLDVVSGFVVTISAARRDIGIAAGMVD